MTTSGSRRRGVRRPAAPSQTATAPRSFGTNLEDEGLRVADPAAPGTADRLATLDGWLGKNKRIALLVLVLLSALTRGIYFAELNGGPFIRLHQWAQTDMNYFHNWGKAIADGDVLSESVGVPMHAWHLDVAAKWFAAHPEVLAELERQSVVEGKGRTPAMLLWASWTGGRQFYQDPLHAYMIGATYSLFGADPRFVIAWQLLLGIVSVALVFSIAARYFGDTVGAVAGVMVLLCGPLMYYEGLLLRDSTIACAALGVVWLTQRAIDTRRAAWFALLGLLLGLGVMLKSTFALLAVFVAVGLALALRRASPLKPLAILVACAVLAIVPFAIRNVAVGVPPLAMAGSGTLTFVASNDVGYPKTGGFFTNPAQLAAVLGVTGGRAIPAIVETLGRLSPADALSLVWNKFQASWHWYEVPNNANYYYQRLMTPVLRCLPVTFFAIGPLSLVGMALARRRYREVWPLLAVVLSAVVSLSVFLVLGRLRLLLLAAALPFAAFATVQVLRSSRRVQVACVTGVVLLGLWTGRPLPDDRPLVYLTDWLMPFLVDYEAEVKAAMEAHDDGRTAAAYLAFLRYEPDFDRFARDGAGLATESDREVARTFAQIHAVCGQLLKSSGQPAAAEEQIRKAEGLTRLASTR